MSETLKTSPFMVRSFRSIQKNSHLKEKSPIKPLPLGRGGDFSGIFFDNKDFLKYLNVCSYFLGTLAFTSGLNILSLGYFYDNSENLLRFADDFLFSFGVLGFVSANYISKSDLEDPTKKPKKEKVYDKVYNFFRNLVPKKVYG